MLIIAELPTFRRLTRRPPVAMRACRAPRKTALQRAGTCERPTVNAKSADALPVREDGPIDSRAPQVTRNARATAAKPPGLAARRGPKTTKVAREPRFGSGGRCGCGQRTRDALRKLKPRGSPVSRASAWVSSLIPRPVGTVALGQGASSRLSGFRMFDRRPPRPSPAASPTARPRAAARPILLRRQRSSSLRSDQRRPRPAL
jgi:hypothetical protein